MAAECDPALTSSTVSELAEARRTTYLSGRWIWDDQNGETSISITGLPVSLPSNGDCSAYYSWVEEKSATQAPGEQGAEGGATATDPPGCVAVCVCMCVQSWTTLTPPTLSAPPCATPPSWSPSCLTSWMSTCPRSSATGESGCGRAPPVCLHPVLNRAVSPLQ